MAWSADEGTTRVRCMARVPLAALLTILIFGSPAGAAQCGGDFHQFIASMSREAAAAGVSPNIIANAFAGVAQDHAVLAFDRKQRGTFRKTFEQYAATRVTAYCFAPSTRPSPRERGSLAVAPACQSGRKAVRLPG